MSKSLYMTRQLKIGKSEQLDFLALQAGAVYSKTVVTFWRIFRKSNHWISSNAMQKLVRDNNLHSQTVQGLVQTFYEALKSWNSLCKTDPHVKPPRRTGKYSSIPFKSSAIKLKGNMLTLSTGRGNQPVCIPWKFELPKYCEISFNGEEYVLNAVYEIVLPEMTSGEGNAGVSIGDVHLAAASAGGTTVIANGRGLRSKREYLEYANAHFRSKMSKCQKHSRRWNRLQKAKKRTLHKLNNQIKDILHKQTNAIVCAMKKEGVQTVGIGDEQNTTGNVDYRAPAGIVRSMVAYKSERAGMRLKFIDGKHLGKICPKCGEQNESNEHVFGCVKCGFEYHCDGICAINIRNLTEYREYVPVIGDMTPPVGIRYYACSPRTSAAEAA